MKLLPEKEMFFNLLLAKSDNYDTLKEEMETFTRLLVPFLEEINSVLVFSTGFISILSSLIMKLIKFTLKWLVPRNQ